MSLPVSAPTHYEVLDVSPSLLGFSHEGSPSTEPQLLRRAYHRALLRHHPDKAGTEEPKISGYSSRNSQTCALYTVDQITTAYNTLNDTKLRREYELALRQSAAADPASSQQEEAFRTGVEVIDLDDLPFDEASEKWYMECRCGNDKGFEFGEEVLDEREREVFVGCKDCSLWIKVQYEVAPC